VTLSGFLQAQYDSLRISEDQLDASGGPRNYDRFFLRRGRIRLDRSWEYGSATLELDANTVRGPSVGIRRAEATVLYRLAPNDALPVVALTAGILDLPFGYELSESPRTRPFLERSLGSTALFPTEADAGVKLWGGLSFLRYAVAISNGEPLDSRGFPRDPNRAKEVTARLGVATRPLDNFELSAGSSFAIGKGFHAGKPGTKNNLAWRDDNENSLVDAGELVAVPGSAPEPSKNFERWVLGLDLQAGLETKLGVTRLIVEGFLASNYDRGLYVADPVQSGVDAREGGFTIGLTQSIAHYAQLGVRYSHYDPNADWLDLRRGNFQPRSAAIRTVSAVAAAELPGNSRLVFQYDFVRDYLARDEQGVPTDADNNQFGIRLQVAL